VRTGSVPASIIADHINWLIHSRGATVLDIANRAGVDERSIRYILEADRTGRGYERGVYRRTAQAILAVKRLPNGAQHVSTTATRRRIEALEAIGWPRAMIASAVGLNRTTITPCRLNGSEKIEFRTQQLVADYYSARAKHPNFSKRGELVWTKARNLGYAPPWAWFGQEIAAPYGRPDFSQIEDLKWRKACAERYLGRRLYTSEQTVYNDPTKAAS